MGSAQEAEKVVLGAILLDNVALASSTAILSANDFQRDANRLIYRSMLDLFERGVIIDSVTLKAELERRGKLEAIGGAQYLGELLDGLPRMSNVEHWAKIIRGRAVLRDLRSAAISINESCESSATPEEAVDSALAEILRISERAQGVGGFADPETSAKAAMMLLDELIQAQDGIVGLRTGFGYYDFRTGGLKPQQLVVFAARPGMGKTAAAICIADNVAAQGKRVAFVSLEMSKEELTLRRFSRRSGVSTAKLRGNHSLIASMNKVYPKVASDPLFIDDTPALTMTQIRSRVRRLSVEKGGLDLIIVDYLQLIRGERPENRQQEIATIARALKNLAKELKVPVIALSQLSREVEKRDDKRPVLADLRESGEIEQAADIVTFLYRPHVYDDAADPTVAEWNTAKQRNGALFRTDLTYHGELTSFTDRSAEEAA